MANPYRNTGKAGSPAHFIGPLGKAFIKGAKAFGNTAKQYYKMLTKPNAVNQQTTRNIKPFHRDGKTYSREDINEAFKKRFSQYSLGPKMPEVKTVTKKKGLFGGTSYGTDVTPSNITNFNRPDAVVKMKDAMKKSNQYPKSDPFRGSPDLR